MGIRRLHRPALLAIGSVAVALAVLATLPASVTHPGMRRATGPASAGGAGGRALRPRSTVRLVGRSVQGRPIVMQRFGDSPVRVLVVGGVHGDEFGTSVAADFASHLASTGPSAAGTVGVDVIACVNPDGVSAKRAPNARGVDLNSNFPTTDWKPRRTPAGSSGVAPCSEPETKVLVRCLSTARYCRVISLHSKGGVIDYDGPGGPPIARDMSRASRVRVVRLGNGRRFKGSMGRWVSEREHIPIVTWELSSPALTGKVLAGMLAGCGETLGRADSRDPGMH